MYNICKGSLAPCSHPLLSVWVQIFAGNVRQQVADDIDSGPLLFIRLDDIPRRPGGNGRLKHVISFTGIVVPSAVEFEIHRGHFRHHVATATTLDGLCDFRHVRYMFYRSRRL
jgi:hypothetical protein